MPGERRAAAAAPASYLDSNIDWNCTSLSTSSITTEVWGPRGLSSSEDGRDGRGGERGRVPGATSTPEGDAVAGASCGCGWCSSAAGGDGTAAGASSSERGLGCRLAASDADCEAAATACA